MSIEPCPECGKQPTTERVPAGIWVTTCNDCFDHAPDVPSFPSGTGSTAGQAENEWDAEVFCWTEEDQS